MASIAPQNAPTLPIPQSHRALSSSHQQSLSVRGEGNRVHVLIIALELSQQLATREFPDIDLTVPRACANKITFLRKGHRYPERIAAYRPAADFFASRGPPQIDHALRAGQQRISIGRERHGFIAVVWSCMNLTSNFARARIYQ